MGKPNPYEFPMRDEMPTITRNTAAAVASSLTSKLNNGDNDNDSNNGDNHDTKHGNVPMDTGETLTLLEKQRQELNTSLSSDFHVIDVSAPPDDIQKLLQKSMNKFSSVENDAPMTQITTLDNGLRVASQEMSYGHIATVGVLSNTGSRHEKNDTLTYEGVNHVMELLAFQTPCRSLVNDGVQYDNIAQIMDEFGGITFANSGREQFMWCMDVLRPNLDMACDVLSSSVLNPVIADEDVMGAQQLMGLIGDEHRMNAPDMVVLEKLQNAAYRNHPLGGQHLYNDNDLSGLSKDVILDFRQKFLLDRPQEMVLAGAGIEHEKLVELGERHFAHLTQKSTSENDYNLNGTNAISNAYSGGEYREEYKSVDGMTRVAVAFEIEGWNDFNTNSSSSDLVPACVLQVLLGGGSSFSAGGPGKGMYSRLYREVLNRYYWVEAAEAFTMFHSESGLLGIKGAAPMTKSKDLVRVICEHFARLALYPVNDLELSRAKNMLKCNVLTQLESRLVLFEDIGRQVLTYGHREGIHEMCQRIDSVSADDIMRIAKKAISTPPTLSSIGDDVANVPTFDEVNRWFSG